MDAPAACVMDILGGLRDPAAPASFLAALAAFRLLCLSNILRSMSSVLLYAIGFLSAIARASASARWLEVYDTIALAASRSETNVPCATGANSAATALTVEATTSDISAAEDCNAADDWAFAPWRLDADSPTWMSGSSVRAP